MIKTLIKRILNMVGLGNYATFIYQVYLKDPSRAKYSRLFGFHKYEFSDQINIPPMYLRWLVINQWDPQIFIRSGKIQVEKLILPILKRNGEPMSSFKSVLDFGCGCGRIIRHWKDFNSIDIWGTDYNKKMIQWCEKNLRFAHFVVNDIDPPLSFEDGKFDFVCARSIFTHLKEGQQIPWLQEINRVLKIGGFLLITVAGDFYRNQLTEEESEIYDSGRLLVRKANKSGQNACAVFHPHAYVYSILTKTNFEILEMVPGATIDTAWQDTYLVRKVSNCVNISVEAL